MTLKPGTADHRTARSTAGASGPAGQANFDEVSEGFTEPKQGAGIAISPSMVNAHRRSRNRQCRCCYMHECGEAEIALPLE
jgi:hypothetical protein